MNESPAWLMMLADAASRQRALDAVSMADSVLAGMAPCQSKDGKRVYHEITRELLKHAGV